MDPLAMSNITDKAIDHPIQGIMSRTGSFPIHVASDLLAEYAPEAGAILDPFCGKGTTLLSARLLGLKAYGMDVAPEAVICSLAKLQDVTLASAEDYIYSLHLGRPSLNQVPANIRIFFADNTLRQLLSTRNLLKRDVSSSDPTIRANATLVIATLLGILHGHASYSLSISSAHAYSMAPTYVEKYAKENNLSPPERDVKECLIKKLHRCLTTPLPPPVEFDVVRGSALECSQILRKLKGKIDIILTSPPYLNAQTYAKDNWLRLWLLGYNYKTIQSDYLQTGSTNLYRKHMYAVFEQFNMMLKNDGKVICIAGTIPRKIRDNGSQSKEPFDTGSFLHQLMAEEALGFEEVSFREQSVSSENRYYHSLCKTNGHSRRSLTESILVASKRNGRG